MRSMSPVLMLLLAAAWLAACGTQTSPAASALATSTSASRTPAPGESTSAEASASPSAASRVPDRLALRQVASGLNSPIGITNAGDGSNRLFINEQGGRVRVISASGELMGEPFLDIADRLTRSGNEQGFLGLAFHPNFERNGRLFVHYSRASDGATVVSEIQASPDHQRADPGSERVLLTVEQPFSNHNGGQLAFGPDGYLYIGLGDGGSGGDPFGNGQSRQTLLGKILRIDVDSPPAADRAYAIPHDNPYAPDGREPGRGRLEIWAYGLRNPWRFSFDAETAELYIGDVGQNAYEEIDRAPARSRGGENYGWNILEGNQCYLEYPCDQSTYVSPITEYPHSLGCSVTGGYVYRGNAFPDLQGIYVFADYCSGWVFAIDPAGEPGPPTRVLESGVAPAAFGTSEDGELYVADRGGTVQQVILPD